MRSSNERERVYCKKLIKWLLSLVVITTPEQIARLFCVFHVASEAVWMEYQLHLEKHSSLTDAALDDVM